MNNRTTTYLRAILILSLFVLLTSPIVAQNKSNIKMGALDYTSNIVVDGTAEGINNLGFNNETGFAGVITGTLNGQPQKFYCIDIAHTVNPNQHPTYWDEGTTPSEMTYILNNYFPYKTSYTGKLSDNNKEAAAVQLAIWHFSDGVDANTISDATVKSRAIAIIADATANHNNVIPLQSLIFVPATQSLVQGTNATFDVYAQDLNGNPIANLQITLSKTLGTLSATSGTTNSSGRVGPITLSYSGTGTATVKAQATVVIAQGTRYVDKNDPTGKQKLVLATPTTDIKEINSTITWYTPGTPGTCDTKGFTTFTQGGWGSPSNSTPGKIRDLYFSTVFPSGLTVGGGFKLTLTSAAAVMNYLPDGGTAAVYTQNYNNPTSKINVLSGQLTALKLNVAYDAAGKIGNNATNLGDLSIATGPFTGMTVNSFLAFAETAIGGGTLNGHTFSEINDAATSINENFDNGTTDKGFLTCSSELKASLGDRVWEDTNKNGIQDAGELGIANVTVKLYDCSNNLISTKTTDASGLYLFSNLTPGSYYVQFVLPSGYVFTTKDAGTNDTVDSDADITTGKTICTTLSGGENDLTWDAGMYKECKDTIGSYVYRDINANGTKDSGELGIQGVVVELLTGTTVISNATTDATGKYSFANLSNGSYTVRLAASNFATEGVFFNTAAVKWYTKNSTSVNTTLSCNDNLSINFGYYKTCVGITKTADKATYKVGDVVTYTIKVENCGDIQLHGGVDVYDNLLWGATAYHIDVIDAGQIFTIPSTNTKYTVKAADCGNLINTARAEGHPVDGSATVIAETSVTVAIDCSVCNNTIGSYVYRDLNVNGTKDTGEAGIAGVIVELVQGTTVTPTTTDVNGHYSFTNVLNGTYTVRIAASNFTSGGAFYNTAQTKWYTKNSASVNTTLNCNDNLSINFGYYKTCVTITKSADKQSYNKGETITYSFLVENCGDIQLHGGIDIFDAMLNTSGNHLIKHIDVLDPHQSTTFTMTYVTGDGDCGQLSNTARAEGHPVDGSATVIDESTWTVNIICQDKADIKIEKMVDNANPKCDDEVTFTIKATNLGPNAATGVQVSDLLPAGLDYVSSSASQGSYNNTTGIWNIGTIANSAFATLTIRVKVDCGNINNSTFNLGTAKDYNLFVIEDAIQPSSDTQGKVAVGRDAQFANYSVGDQLPANSGDVLIVGRDLTYTSGAVYSGNIVYGHSTNLPLSMVSIAGGSLRKDTPINFAAEKVYLENLSTTLSTYTVNGTTTSQWGGLTLTGSDPFLNIFSVSGSVLSTANNFVINVPNGSVVLININGTSVSWTGGLVVNGTAISNVLYNFNQATALTISGIDVRGTILAPFAAVNFASGVLNGQMICKSLTGMGQFNFVMFGGQIPFEKKVTNVASVSSCLTPDPNSNNNSSSATITMTNTTTGGNGNNGNNGNGSWTNVCSFAQGEIVYTMLYDGGNIYAGTWGGKIYKSTDAGKNWSRVNNGMNVSFIWSLIKFNGNIYAATEMGVFKFDGTTACGLAGKDVHALATDGTTLYAGTWGFGVFKSTNGTSWTELNNNTFGGFLAIQSLTIKGSVVFAGTAGGGIFKSTDGMNFSKLSCGYSVIWSLASTSTTLFSGTYGDGLYRSDDNGMSFTKVTSLNITFVYSISVDMSGKIYVSSLTNGVFVSSDNGATWSSLGMGGSGVSAMMVNPNSSDVYVGTKDGKVFTISSNSGITAVEDNTEVPTEFKLAQNYPNPFNPTTTIEFAVPKAGNYSLKVYNVLGEEVANLVDNQLASGLHKVNFDASRLASGMYIYRLSGSNVNISKKMILMK